MNIFLVTHENLGRDKHYIVEAENKKDAIDKVYNLYFLPFVKSDKKEGYKPVYKKELLCININKEISNKKIFSF
jgi:hypothetical protein